VAQLQEWPRQPRQQWRKLSLDCAALVIGRPLSGVCAEVGAGRGPYTACVSRLPKVERIYAAE